jgi:hypothetical protein
MAEGLRSRHGPEAPLPDRILENPVASLSPQGAGVTRPAGSWGRRCGSFVARRDAMRPRTVPAS